MKVILRIVFLYYLTWSNIYNYFRRKRKNFAVDKTKSLSLIDKVISKYSTHGILNEDTILELSQFKRIWYNICIPLKWKKDEWFMLWDVIPNIVDVLITRNGDDCDGFARLSYTVFGESFRIFDNSKGKLEVYKRDGIWFLISGTTGHAITVWVSQSSSKMLVVSNNVSRQFCNFGELIKWIESEFEYKPKWLIKVEENKKSKLVFRYITKIDYTHPYFYSLK